MDDYDGDEITVIEDRKTSTLSNDGSIAGLPIKCLTFLRAWCWLNQRLDGIGNNSNVKRPYRLKIAYDLYQKKSRRFGSFRTQRTQSYRSRPCRTEMITTNRISILPNLFNNLLEIPHKFLFIYFHLIM